MTFTHCPKILKALIIPAFVTLLPCAFRFSLLLRVEPWIAYLIGVALIAGQPDSSYNPGSVFYKSDQDQRSALTIILVIYSVGLTSVLYFVWRQVPISSSARLTALCLGLFVGISGLTLRQWSIKTLGRFFSTRVETQTDHQLIKDGPYKKIRHPSYAGAILALVSPSVLFAAWPLVFVNLGGLIVAYHWRIRVEERVLRQKLGVEYENYMKETGALFPPLRKAA
jgi:protein-S-isoprenylcysteine O-methyltransferase Ste14